MGSERTVYKAAEGVDELRDVSGDHIVLKEPITSNISICSRESAGGIPRLCWYTSSQKLGEVSYGQALGSAADQNVLQIGCLGAPEGVFGGKIHQEWP